MQSSRAAQPRAPTRRRRVRAGRGAGVPGARPPPSRHPDDAESRGGAAEDPQEQMARERGLTYVKLDGTIGIPGNGAGPGMSTLDVVTYSGGEPANFLDDGGGANAEQITEAVEVILSNEKVTAV